MFCGNDDGEMFRGYRGEMFCCDFLGIFVAVTMTKCFVVKLG